MLADVPFIKPAKAERKLMLRFIVFGFLFHFVYCFIALFCFGDRVSFIMKTLLILNVLGHLPVYPASLVLGDY